MLDLGNWMKRLGKYAGAWNIVARIIDVLPLIIPSALAAFGAVAVSLLIAGRLENSLVWPLGLLAAAVAAGLVVWRRPHEVISTERSIANILVLLAVLVWTVFNALFATQHVFTTRDPGTYAVAGKWLTTHQSLQIDAPRPFGRIPDIEPTSAGFSLATTAVGEHLDAQGTHLLPVLFGLMGRFVGDVVMFHTQVLFGAAALIVFYGMARKLVRPYWALAATGVIAASLPMIYFSRDTFTEPLGLLFTFGALMLIWEGQAHRRFGLWLVAGLVNGAGMLARVDGILTIDALLVFLIIYLALAKPAERMRRIGESLLFVAGTACTTSIAMLDLSQLSRRYLHDIWGETRSQLLLGGLVLAGGVVGVVAVWLWPKVLRSLDRWSAPRRAKYIWGSLVVYFLFLLSRVFWYKGYLETTSSSGGVLHTTQTQSYSELVAQWPIWYIGPLLGALSLLGLLIVIRKVFNKQGLLLVPFVLVVVGTAVFYLYSPHVYPDQIWGSRRLLPVILPGMAVLAVMGFAWICTPEGLAHVRRLLPRRNAPNPSILITVVATLALITPLFISYPFLLRSEDAWLSPVKELCKALPPHAAVLWVGAARTRLVEPTVAFCNVPSEGYGPLFDYTQNPSRQTLAEAAQNAVRQGYDPIVGGLLADTALLGSPEQLTTITSFTYEQIELTWTRPPTRTMVFNDAIVLGKVDTRGRITPLKIPAQNQLP